MKLELNAEIERSKELAAKSSRNPPSALRGRPAGADDPKHAAVIRFYEDLTNLLVCNIKLQRGRYFGLDEWLLSCVFTYTDTDNDTPSTQKSEFMHSVLLRVNVMHLLAGLNFTLRCYHEIADPLEPVESHEQLVPSINYIPLELNKEPLDFVEKLGFLGAPFTFGRDQLPLFLRTLHTNMGDATKGDGEDEDSSIQILEPHS